MSKDVAASDLVYHNPHGSPREQAEGLFWDKGAMSLDPQAGTLGMGSKAWPRWSLSALCFSSTWAHTHPGFWEEGLEPFLVFSHMTPAHPGSLVPSSFVLGALREYFPLTPCLPE